MQHRKLLAAGLAVASLIAPAVADAATTPAYDSTPAPGTVTVPSLGPEAYSFNELGNEVILGQHKTIRRVAVTMVSWACESGSWNTGCTTTPGATFNVPITLNLYRFTRDNAGTSEMKPGRKIASYTRTFAMKYRPSSVSPDEHRYMGSDGVLHNGIAQTIRFPVNRHLPGDVVWTVSFNTNTSGPAPVGHATPQDSLNVGLSPAVRVSHDRFPGSIVWDTRFGGDNVNNDPSFVLGELNLNHGWNGYVPAARFVR